MGLIRDNRGQYFGNVESRLSYGKLHRTGRLLKGLRVRRDVFGNVVRVMLYNRVSYAAEHELGMQTGKSTVLKRPMIHNASSVKLGGQVAPRPFMTPSPKILQAPYRLTTAKIKEFGWSM